MPLVVNLQRKIKLDSKRFTQFSDHLSATVTETSNGSFSIAFISDRRMTELNRFFRGRDSTTDVLSFPHEPDDFVQSAGFSPSGSSEEQAEAYTLNANYLGDIVISIEQAQRQAEENGLTLENEIKQLILHGLLHLCGYDHETDNGEMNKRELELRRELKI
jgi:probable rRNA maturation factor